MSAEESGAGTPIAFPSGTVNMEPIKSRLSFVPLEANPELLTQLAHKLGLSTALQFVDVFSLTDPEMLAFIPRPCLALLLVFPLEKSYEEARKEMDEKLGLHDGKGQKEPLWIKQTIRNACGLMAMLHAMLNGQARDFITPDSTLSKLLDAAVPADTEARTKLLETDEFMARSYGEVAVRGDTVAPDAKDDLDLHYVCFVKDTPAAADGKSNLWELDGRRKGPIHRASGLAADEDVLSEKAVKEGPLQFLERNGGKDLRFSCVALVSGS